MYAHICGWICMLVVIRTCIWYLQIKLVNVSADDIEDGNTKLTLSLTWAIIQQFYVRELTI